METGILLQPFLDLFALMDAEVVADDVNVCDVFRDDVVQMFQEGDELGLTLSSTGLAVDTTRPRVESGKQVQRPLAFIFMLNDDGFARSCRFGRSIACSRLKGRLFVEANDRLVRSQPPGVEVAYLGYRFPERLVAGRLGTKPHVVTPRLQAMVQENASDGLGRDALDRAG